MPTPYRHPKTGIYWIKGTIPPDVAQRMGKKQYRRSLATSSHSEVKPAYARVMLALEAEWEAVRNGPPTLTMRQLTALTGETYARLMQRYGDDPGPAPWPAIAALMDHATGPNPQITFEHSALGPALSAKGIPAIDNTPAAHTALSKATGHAASQLARHAGGDFTPDTSASRYPPWPSPAPTADAITFTDAIDLWARKKKPAPEIVPYYRSMVMKFEAFLGHTDLYSVTTHDVMRWCEHLQDTGISQPLHVRDGYLAAIRTVCNIAVQSRLLPANPAAGVTIIVPKKTRGRSKGFKPEEALAILQATLQPQPARLHATHKAARRWVPWICAYTGARVGEITQLRKQDVVKHGNVWGIDITPDAGTVKTGENRLIPLHPDLIDQGFAAFVLKQKAGPLFYQAGTNDGAQNRRDDLAVWVRKGIGITDLGVAPNYGWRHLFKTRARVAKMDPEARAYIPGHAASTVGEQYGDNPLEFLYPEIIKLPPFDLSSPLEALGSLPIATAL